MNPFRRRSSTPAPPQPAPPQPAPPQPSPAGTADQGVLGDRKDLETLGAGKGASKLDLAERSYKEVLDATKHQDDKVGRFLTAIAFLTTGAIALITTNPGSAVARDFTLPDGSSQPVLAWATGAFLAFTLGSVTLLLLCLSVPVRLPKYSRDPLGGSRLFYSYIAARPAREWSKMWVQDDTTTTPSFLNELADEITDDYVKESHNLAERTSAKYRHSYEAAWLFVCALLFLGIAIYLRLLTSLHDSGDINLGDELPLSILVTIVSIHAVFQVYARAVHDIRSAEKAYDAAYAVELRRRLKKAGISKSDPKLERNLVLHWQRRRTPLSVIAPIGFAVAVAGTWDSEYTAPIVAGLSVLTGIWVTFDTWLESEDPKEIGERIHFYQLRALWLPVASAVVAAAVAWGTRHVGGGWQVAAIPLPVLVLGLINTSRPARSHARARKLVRKRAVDAAKDAADRAADGQVGGSSS